jgi:hypothetical protein
MIDGGLIQLVACGSLNIDFQLKACTYSKRDFIDGQYFLERFSDLAIPTHLCFSTNIKINIDKFIDILENMSIEIIFGDKVVYNINMSLISKINQIKLVNDQFILKLPFDFLLGYINIVSLSVNYVKIKIQGIHEIINKVSGIFEFVLIETSKRYLYARNYLYYCIFNIKKIQNVLFEKEKNNYIVNFDKKKNKLGLFIESIDHKIDSLEIDYNNKIFLLNNCEIINDKLCYFSFNGSDYKNDKKNRSVVQINKLNISSTSKLLFHEFHMDICYNNLGIFNLFEVSETE